MAWVKNKRDEQFENHWWILDDNGKELEGEFESRAEAEKRCAEINTPEAAEEAPPAPDPKATKAKKGAKKK